VTYLDVTPGGFGGSAVLSDNETGRKYVLSRDNAVALAWRLLAVAVLPNRVVANGTQPQPAPVPPPPIPFTPGPAGNIDPAFAALEAARANKEANRLPVSPPAPPATGGTSTFGP